MLKTILISVVIVYFGFANNSPGFAQGENIPVRLTIGIEGGSSNGAQPFVFAEGKLAGIIPGTVSLPINETVPIEIGIAQFKFSPLYSFKFGLEAVKTGSVTLVTTNYIMDKATGSIILKPNTTKKLAIRKLRSNDYSVTLPQLPRGAQEIRELWNKVDESGNKIDAGITIKASPEYASNALHLGYKESGEFDKTLPLKNPSDWSGGHLVEYSGGLFDPFHAILEKWTIVSSPEGALIYSADGKQGATNATVSVSKSLSSFIILRLDGYRQCSEAECDKTETVSGSVTLRCALKKDP
jgi:hypothetical protein